MWFWTLDSELFWVCSKFRNYAFIIKEVTVDADKQFFFRAHDFHFLKLAKPQKGWSVHTFAPYILERSIEKWTEQEYTSELYNIIAILCVITSHVFRFSYCYSLLLTWSSCMYLNLHFKHFFFENFASWTIALLRIQNARTMNNLK